MKIHFRLFYTVLFTLVLFSFCGLNKATNDSSGSDPSGNSDTAANDDTSSSNGTPQDTTRSGDSLPTPVVLSEPSMMGDIVTLTWSASVDSDFAYYKVIKDIISSVSDLALPERVITIRSDTSCALTHSANVDTCYYYILSVNLYGYSSPSNIRFSVYTGTLNPPPEHPQVD